jgi:uracil-DNA glycosylase family 4
MPDRTKYDIDFRPESYWDDPVQMLLANIKGEHRRRNALELIREGRLDALEQWLISEKLSPELRELAGRIHPMFMGGEYLPDCEQGEVEVARVSLESTTADVISIRAKRDGDVIKYQIVDEYESEFEFAPTSSKEPLTLGELISLMDSVEYSSEDGGLQGPRGLTTFFRDSNLQSYSHHWDSGLERNIYYPDEILHDGARRLVDFVTVTSSYYPELVLWYREEAQEWLNQHLQPRLTFDIHVTAAEKLFAATAKPEAGVTDQAIALTLIQADLGECTRCALAGEGRKVIVFGEGNPNPELMFVGECPSVTDDEQGRPFVGRAGELLNNMILAMGLERKQTYLTNIVKCRPPEARAPLGEECEACLPFLFRQIEVICPKVIIALGRCAAGLTGLIEPLSNLRGRLYDLHGTPLAITYHPAYLLRNPSLKKGAWKDLQVVMRHLKLPLPTR